MIPIMDFQDRSLKGPVMKADEFDLAFSMKVRELVGKYNIKYNPEEIIIDDATADAIFRAGVELLVDVGLYHIDTQRVVQFTEEEILAIAKEYKNSPGEATMGLGDDKITLKYRTGSDVRPPALYAGACGVIDEEWFVPYIQSVAQEETVLGMGCTGGIAKVGNIEPKSGTLSEIYCGLWEQKQLLEVLQRVGRPGMSLGLLMTVTTPGAIMECIRPGLREAHNTHIGIHIMPEQKIDWNRLILAHFCDERKIVPWQSAMSMVGGLCRDAADTAVALIANALGQISYGHGATMSFFSTHMDGTLGTFPTIWAIGAACRASERNIYAATGACICGSLTQGRGGSKVGFCSSAAEATVLTASGLAYAWMAGGTGLEARLLGEIMNVTAGMEKKKANRLAIKIIEKAEALLAQDPTPEHFTDMYNVKTIKPKPKYETALLKIKDDLARMGMPFKS